MSKYSSEIKIKACEDYLSGKLSHKEICMKYGIHFCEKESHSMLNDWLPRYLANGAAAFLKTALTKPFALVFRNEGHRLTAWLMAAWDGTEFIYSI